MEGVDQIVSFSENDSECSPFFVTTIHSMGFNPKNAIPKNNLQQF